MNMAMSIIQQFDAAGSMMFAASTSRAVAAKQSGELDDSRLLQTRLADLFL